MKDQADPVHPLVIEEADAPRDGWDDPVRGRLRWRTLFSQGLTQRDGMTCGVTELRPGDWLGCIGTRRRKSITCSPAQGSSASRAAKSR